MSSKIINNISHIFPLKSMIGVSGQRLFLPFYHAVYLDQPQTYIKHLYPVRSVKQFMDDLDRILRNFEPVDLEFVIKYAQSDRKLSKNVFHLTFDDGLRECYDLIAPELMKRGIPATFFINNSFLDNKDLFYRYKVSLILESMQEDHAVEKHIATLLNLSATRSVKEELLMMNHGDTERINNIGMAIELDFKQFLESQRPYMTSDNIRSLIDRGFTIGGHSLDHPHYASLDLDQQWNQTTKSVQELQQQFDLDYAAFAFPFTDDGVDKALFEKIAASNILDITFGTSGLKKDEFEFHLHRTAMEDQKGSANQRIKSEYLYYLLKSVVGKNRKTR